MAPDEGNAGLVEGSSKEHSSRAGSSSALAATEHKTAATSSDQRIL